MLNSEMKKRIDDARDILVWKIPVPSQQIEQITIALIYKFMSDIDKQDKELWGDWFFQWEYEQYSWDKVMDRKLWWQERLKLYSEWLDNLDKNPYLPQMFRDIFKNAYLPFKDPATLDMFLKQIDKFSYDHSEDLWDAFEYLLSTAWSQWDAGQFRTPRHIIDFIVSIVQPEFNDTVLDPACWTAWFLISAYKYILNQNKDKVAWDKLSLTQKKSLTEHFVWYDISPEMVKLSLVNMYLHNFGNPKIYEYDTLSDDSKWDDRFDCILANPPFMTPKGWIQPHNRFSIKASKSEVLFVDYMIEHLNPNWKAWIVVPEWIIFQSANAYKDLRKKMIKENYLWAVISLPGWIFQPYSWVKTSILLFDQELAKRTKNILFVKIQNDWFDLWAQRKLIKQNDLPKAVEVLLQYKEDLLAWNEIKIENSDITLLVSKEKIEENSEFNLSMDRYKWGDISLNSNFELSKIWDICEILDSMRKPISKWERNSGNYPYYWASWIVDYIDDYIFDEKAVLIWEDWAKWWAWDKTAFIATGKYWVNNHCHILRPNRNLVYDELLVYLLNSMDLEWLVSGWVIPKLTQKDLRNIEIPLPPIEVQEKFVEELNSYQKIIDWAKTVVENYKPTIKINPKWKIVKLGDICEVWSSKRVFESEWRTEWVPFYRAREIVKLAEEWYVDNELFIDESMYEEYTNRYWKPQKWDLLVTWVWTLWICYEVKEWDKFYFKDWNIIRFFNFNKEEVSSTYIKYLYKTDFIKNQISTFWVWGVVWTYTITHAKNTNIPLPSLEEQNQIVAEIEKEEAMVESAKQLIGVFEKKIKDRIDEIRGKSN